MKIDFELHIYCYEYELSNIINWQHISRWPSGRNFGRNFYPPRPGTLNFNLLRRFFSEIDKINNFWQQKQLLLFISNINHKVLLCCFLLLRPPSQPQKGLKHKKTTFSGDLPSKIAPHRRFGGSKFLATHIFSIFEKKSPLFVEKVFFYL